jgi:hypothetical protein
MNINDLQLVLNHLIENYTSAEDISITNGEIAFTIGTKNYYIEDIEIERGILHGYKLVTSRCVIAALTEE